MVRNLQIRRTPWRRSNTCSRTTRRQIICLTWRISLMERSPRRSHNFLLHHSHLRHTSLFSRRRSFIYNSLHFTTVLWNQGWKILIFHVLLGWRKEKKTKTPSLPHHSPRKVHRKTPFLDLNFRTMGTSIRSDLAQLNTWLHWS